MFEISDVFGCLEIDLKRCDCLISPIPCELIGGITFVRLGYISSYSIANFKTVFKSRM